jgi:hypothetical protein
LSQLIDLEEDEDEALFVASASIRVVDNAIMKAVVKCYFKGSHYLVAAFERRAIFFDHDTELELNQEVSLMLS